MQTINGFEALLTSISVHIYNINLIQQLKLTDMSAIKFDG